MPIIRVSEARGKLKMLSDSINGADARVEGALQEFAKQVDALAAMNATGSAQRLAVADIVETADDPANATDPFWLAAKSEALGMQTDVSERLAKYVAALPQVRALRES